MKTILKATLAIASSAVLTQTAMADVCDTVTFEQAQTISAMIQERASTGPDKLAYLVDPQGKKLYAVKSGQKDSKTLKLVDGVPQFKFSLTLDNNSTVTIEDIGKLYLAVNSDDQMMISVRFLSQCARSAGEETVKPTVVNVQAVD